MRRSSPEADSQGELARLRAALAAAGDIVYEWNLADDSIVWHGDLTNLFPTSANDGTPIDGETLSLRVHPDDLVRRLQALSEHLSTGAAYDCEFRLRGPDGEYHWVHDRGAIELAPGGTALRMMGTLRLVTERKVNEARLEYLAHFDELTGHYNKTRLQEALDQAISDASRSNETGAFVVFGIDQLAMINSAYGYEVGDAVLREVGHRLDQCLRGNDVVGRVSGDRFGAVLKGIDENEAVRAAERAVHEIRRQTVETPAGSVRVTSSAGICLFPGQSSTALDAMAKAEGALREAKVQGRNRSGLYQMSEAQARNYRASMDIGTEVQQAMKEGRLAFAYQPIVEARGHAVRFHECLLRLHRADGEIVAAGKFVPVIEQLGLMRALDRRVLDMAVEELRNHPDAVLAINISGLTATERSWLRALTSKLQGRRDLARRLIIEITETAALEDVEESMRFVRAVRELGCRVALDDFGAGYTTFRHLKALTVDIVKIDGSFVRNISSDPQNQLFVRNLIALANSLDVETVAECIETPEEAAMLADEGAVLLQGYHFGRPDTTKPWLATLEDNADGKGQVVDMARWGGQRDKNAAG